MKRCLQKLALGLLFVSNFTFQAFSLNSGHMLDRFELIADGETPLLSFKGFFDTSQFLNIQINSGKTKTETSVIIPNSYINSLLLREKEITSFPEDVNTEPL